MSESTEWCTVVNKKRERRKERFLEVLKEREKWDNLKSKCPFIVMPQRADRIKRKLNIDKLDEKFRSDEWINYQVVQGWRYIKTLKLVDINSIPKNTETAVYSTLQFENEWGDIALFCRE